MKTNSRKEQTAHARPLLEPGGFSQLDLVLDLSLRPLLPPAVSSNVAAFLQLSTTSSGEDRWLNLQIHCLQRMVYVNFATTADWPTADTGVGPTSSKQVLTAHLLNARCAGSICSHVAPSVA